MASRQDLDWLHGREPLASGSHPATPPPGRPRSSRRGLLVGGAATLGLAGLGLAGLETLRTGPGLPGIGGGVGPRGKPTCLDASQLASASRIGRARIIYEPTGKPATMRFDAGFLGQLEAWMADFEATSRYGGSTEVWSYGAHVVKDQCRSWHANGRAFDISRLRIGSTPVVSAREDLWHEASAERQAELRRRYWTLAASLHLHFAYVLTHHFDPEHRNHIHVDNGLSGSGMSSFSRGSRVQNQAVQAICQSIWGQQGEVTGQWDETQDQAGPVLAELGLRDLRRQETWQAFLRASVQRG